MQSALSKYLNRTHGTVILYDPPIPKAKLKTLMVLLYCAICKSMLLYTFCSL